MEAGKYYSHVHKVGKGGSKNHILVSFILMPQKVLEWIVKQTVHEELLKNVMLTMK